MEKRYIYGVDVGGTSIKIGLFTDTGVLMEKFSIPTRRDASGEYILSDIAEAIKGSMSDNGVDFESLVGVGVGVPGAVLADGIVNRCINLGWGIKDVAKELSTLLEDTKVSVANDANIAALGEMWKGGGQGYSTLVMVTLGTGVGGGLVMDGRIVPGAFGAAGEIGLIKVNKHEKLVCGCGRQGCLEQYASATGIARLAREMLGKDLTAKAVFDLAKAGDEGALEVARLMADNLGLALAAVSGVVDPQALVIGGGVSNAGDFLIDLVKPYYIKYAFHASENTDFALAKLGNDAGIYGAAKMMLED